MIFSLYYNITVIIVSGQSAMESMGFGDFVEQDVQLLCKQLFPVVYFYKFSSFNHTRHPSCLTRGLLCCLSQVSLFTNDYNLSACWFYWYNLNLLIELSSTIYSLTVPDGKVQFCVL